MKAGYPASICSLQLGSNVRILTSEGCCSGKQNPKVSYGYQQYFFLASPQFAADVYIRGPQPMG